MQDNNINNVNSGEKLEESLAKLDAVIADLENEDISLEDAFKSYSEGIRLVKECNNAIDRVEKKVQCLMENGETGDFE